MNRALVFCLILLTGPAAASGELSVGPVAVVLENGRDADCLDPAFCVAAMTGGSLGETELDASQRFYYAGILVNDSALSDAPVHELLPDGLLLDARAFIVRHDIFRLYVANVGTQRAPGPLSAFGIAMDEESYGITYFGPSLQHPTQAPAERGIINDFSEEGEGLGYDSIGLADETINETSDGYVRDALAIGCSMTESAECEETGALLAATVEANAPSVKVGFGVYEIGLNEPPSAPPDSLGDRAPVGPLDPARRSPEAPAMLPREPPALARPFAPAGSERQAGGPDPRAPSAASPVPPLRAAGERADPPGRAPVFVALAIAFAIALAIASLYSRLRGSEEKLLSPTRVRLLDELARRGPLHYSELARALGLDRKTVEHHARVLAREGRVTLSTRARHVYVGLPGQQTPAPRPRSAASAACRNILEALTGVGGTMDRRDVGRHVPGLPQRTRNHAIRVLESEGFIEQVWRPQGLLLKLRRSDEPGGTPSGAR